MDLSIIIPAYNEEKYIENTLKSITQGEIIVVCNGCTDNTADIARKYTNKVLEIPDKGVSKARNLGASLASHNRLIFLDADTKLSHTILNKIANSTYNIGSSKVRADSERLRDKGYMYIKSFVNKNLSRCSGLIFCDKIIFDKVGGFPEDKAIREDTFFIFKAKDKGNFICINDIVYTDMRRYKRLGYLYLIIFWLKEWVLPSKKDYETIR